MKYKIGILLAFLTLLTTSCGQVRISMISEHSGLELPEKYKVKKNTTKSSGFAGQDIEISIVLKFEGESLENIMDQIDSLVFSNPHWERRANGAGYHQELNSGEQEWIDFNVYQSEITYKFIMI